MPNEYIQKVCFQKDIILATHCPSYYIHTFNDQTFTLTLALCSTPPLFPLTIDPASRVQPGTFDLHLLDPSQLNMSLHTSTPV